jgi:oligopeptide transport system permease protein
MSDPDALAASLSSPEVRERAAHEGNEPPQLPGSEDVGKPRSLWRDAYDDLKRRPLFLISLVLIAIFVLMALFPQLFALGRDPFDCDLSRSRQAPSSEAWFGYDLQGCDVYARTIYGARASILVGVLTTLSVVVIGGVVGMTAGFFGRWVDSIASRITDIFFAIPLLLGGIMVLTAFPSNPQTPELVTIFKVVLALSVLGWTAIARIMRSSVIQVKSTDFVQAARALGASSNRIITRHVLPNSLAPVIVVAMISLGGYISAEATLSFLGIGLQPPVVSWGIAINDAATYVRTSPHMLLFPAAFLSLTVFAFIMMGDAVRDALDPKLR